MAAINFPNSPSVNDTSQQYLTSNTQTVYVATTVTPAVSNAIVESWV